ncbi:MAG: hypothetical protein N2234_00570 [Planctomycetota bacterium]|nr:hypothetical protein [Planctomycetota bacterium]
MMFKMMRKRVLLAVLFLSLSALATLQSERTINRERFPEVAPGEFIITVLLAGARPFAVSYFWIKAGELQEERDYWRLKTLYEVIVTLEPRFAAAWDFALYNMAVSIALFEQTLEKQFLWAKKGLLFGYKGAEKTKHSGIVPSTLSFILLHFKRNFPALAALIEKDPELNPKALPILLLSLEWAERATSVKHHPIIADWIRDSLYRELYSQETSTKAKIGWIKKGLEFWNSLKLLRPDRADVADKNINELREILATLEEER